MYVEVWQSIDINIKLSIDIDIEIDIVLYIDIEMYNRYCANSMVIRYGSMLDNEEALPITDAAAALITHGKHL